MVRLKVKPKKKRIIIKHISIPYGSIKSVCQFIVLFAWEISIPYGSIKRKYAGRIEFTEETFQFLMVRLKVHQSGKSN